VKKFSIFYGTSLFLCSKEPVTGPISDVHTFSPYLSTICFDITLPSTPMSRPFRYYNHNIVFISHLFHAWPTHLILLDLVSLVTFCEEHNLWNNSLRSFLHHTIIFSLFGPYILSAQYYGFHKRTRNLTSWSSVSFTGSLFKLGHKHEKVLCHIEVMLKVLLYPFAQ
jgi:hypothetical protein